MIPWSNAPKTLLPDNHIFRRYVLGLPIGSLALNIGSVQRSGYLEDEAGSGEFRVKVGLDCDGIRDRRCPNLIHGGQNLDGKFHV